MSYTRSSQTPEFVALHPGRGPMFQFLYLPEVLVIKTGQEEGKVVKSR